MTVIVNGIKYEERGSASQKSPFRASHLMVMAAVLAGYNGSSGSRRSSMPTVNLEEEYVLIQHKKSKLSRRERDWVEQQFHRKYKAVKG